MSPMIKTLLMDLDGTLLAAYDPLVRMEFISRALWRMSRHGGTRVALRALKAVTHAVEHPTLYMSGEHKQLTNAERGAHAFAHATGLELAEADRILREEVGSIFPRLERYFYPVPGAHDFLKWAKPRYRLFLATNPVWPIEQVLLRLKWSGIDPAMFESITHSGRMHACKPSVAYYRQLLEQEGLTASECILVGDDVRKDLPATHAGISVFILDPRSTGAPWARLRKLPVGIDSHGGTGVAAMGSYAALKRALEEKGGLV